MKTCLQILTAIMLLVQINVSAQNQPDVNLEFSWGLINCPSTPQIETSFSLSSADGTTWDIGFIMLTLRADEIVLGTPPQIENSPTGWNTDVYKQGNEWMIELVDPSGGSVSVGNNSVHVFDLIWPYNQEGVTFAITIEDADLGVNNSTEDEQMHYPNGLFISGNDDCASQVGEIDFYWQNPVLSNCPNSPTLTTPVSLASHFAGEVWSNSFIQLIIQQDNNILGMPRVVNSLSGWTPSVYPMYDDWVIELSAPVDTDITDVPQQFFDIEWDYLMEGYPYTVTVSDIDLGLNVPNEIVHRVNGNTISGIHVCPCDIEIQNISVICTDSCQGLGTIFFDVQINNGPGGLVELSLGGNTKTVNVAAGDVLILDESFTDVSLAQSQLIAGYSGFNCADTSILPSVTCGPCEILIQNINTTTCEPATNTYNAVINVSTKALCNTVVNVRIDGNTATPYNLINNELTINDLPADGIQHTITISDSQVGATCQSTMSFSAPPSCHVSATTIINLQAYQVTMFPNPLSNSRSLHIQSETSMSSVDLFNVAGERVVHNKVHSEELTLDLSTLTLGIYFVVVQTNQGQTTEKLIIQN